MCLSRCKRIVGRRTLRERAEKPGRGAFGDAHGEVEGEVLAGGTLLVDPLVRPALQAEFDVGRRLDHDYPERQFEFLGFRLCHDSPASMVA